MLVVWKQEDKNNRRDRKSGSRLFYWELKRKNAAKRDAQTVPKYIRAAARDPASVFHALAPGQHSARSASQRGGLARHENADGSRTALAQTSR
jgi:hypothetical protein